MHLLSHNGPIDVLVCPETDENNTEQTTPTIELHRDQQATRELDVSLSSMASHDADMNGLMDTFPDCLVQPLSSTHQSHFLPDMFECLSPPCDEDEFYPTLSPSEGILELFDLA